MILSKSNSRRRVASLHVLHDSQQSTCTLHSQWMCSSIQYLGHQVEALGIESLGLLNNFQKTLFQTCSIQSKALQDEVMAGTSTLRLGRSWKSLTQALWYHYISLLLVLQPGFPQTLRCRFSEVIM